jgi:hypothetical protein
MSSNLALQCAFHHSFFGCTKAVVASISQKRISYIVQW